jgi:hypothetical protein
MISEMLSGGKKFSPDWRLPEIFILKLTPNPDHIVLYNNLECEIGWIFSEKVGGGK